MDNSFNPAAILVMDFGGSGVRGIGVKVSDNMGKPFLICLDPEVAPVGKESIDAYSKGTLGATEPENRCWIALGKQYYAIGALARERFCATADLLPLKWEDAIRKTLGAVWVLSERLGLGNQFDIAIGAVLPPGEYKNDRERFQSKLTECLKSFNTPSKIFNVNLVFFDCKPEGGGIYLYRRRVLKDAIKLQVMAVAMIGHRNASVLVANKGQVGEGVTSDLGCNKLVDIFVRETSGTSDQHPSSIVRALVDAGSSVTSKPFLKLARSCSDAGKKEDVKQMVMAARLARSEYFQMLRRWLDKTLPRDRDELIFCGGTAHLFKQELSSHYKDDTVLWDADVEIPPTLDTASLGSRLADVYAMYRTFRERVGARLGVTATD